MATIIPTSARQVRVLQCALLAPGLALRAGNAQDTTTLGGGFNLIPYLQKIDIYESIFENTISGTLTLLENIGLTEYLPIVGVEQVAVTFQIDNPDPSQGPWTFSRVFRVIGLKNQAFPRHDFRLYELQLATPEYVVSLSSRICRPFHGVSCHDAVQNILTNDLSVDPSRMDVEQTYKTVDVVIPNYTPLQAVNYFAILAQTVSTQEANFLFFETMADGFHFRSIQDMILNAPTNPTVFDVDSGAVTSTPFVTDADVMAQIMRVHQEQGFDLLFDIASGMLRARMVSIDFLGRRQNVEVDSRYTNSFDETTHLDEFPVYPRNLDLAVDKDVRMFVVPSNVWSGNSAYINSIEQQPEQRLHQSVLVRNRQLKEMRHVETLLDLPGRPELSAGTVVTVKYPSSRVLQGQDVPITVGLPNQPTPYYSGNHLVTSVHHILTVTSAGSAEYRMNLRVNRDSLASPLIGTPDVSDT